jgi:hypothetical protein
MASPRPDGGANMRPSLVWSFPPTGGPTADGVPIQGATRGWFLSGGEQVRAIAVKLGDAAGTTVLVAETDAEALFTQLDTYRLGLRALAPTHAPAWRVPASSNGPLLAYAAGSLTINAAATAESYGSGYSLGPISGATAAGDIDFGDSLISVAADGRSAKIGAFSIKAAYRGVDASGKDTILVVGDGSKDLDGKPIAMLVRRDDVSTGSRASMAPTFDALVTLIDRKMPVRHDGQLGSLVIGLTPMTAFLADLRFSADPAASYVAVTDDLAEDRTTAAESVSGGAARAHDRIDWEWKGN